MLIAENKKTQLYLNHPEIENYDKQIASVFQSVMKKMIAGEKADFKTAEELSLDLQKQKAEYIKNHNIDISVINPKFACEN